MDRSTLRDARRLSALFDRLAAASVAAGALASPGCFAATTTSSGDGGADADGHDAAQLVDASLPPDTEFGPPIDPSAFTPATCVNGRVDFLSGLSPAMPVDAIAAYAREGCIGGLASLIGTQGTPCVNAADPVACANEFAQPPLSGAGCGISLVGESGGVVAGYAGANLVSFLGTIDHPDEAYVIAAEGRQLSCDGTMPAFRIQSDGTIDWLLYRYLTICAPIVTVQEVVRVGPDGSSFVVSRRLASVSNACIGRVPRGRVRTRRSAGAHPAGLHLHRMHALEAASVDAFRELAVALRAHDAPASLVRAALRSAGDEVRHARTVGRLARRFGANPTAPSVDPADVPTLEALAVHNAREGCVNESFGALVGRHQARTASDPAVARAMRIIARDETRHAALAHRIDAWIADRSTSASRRRVEAAREEALVALRRDAERPVDPSLVATLGLPPPAVARALADGFARALRASYPRA